jgi:hypothetical protein
MTYLIIQIIIGVVTGLITAIVATYITVRYVAGYQTAKQINNDLEKCFNDLKTNEKKLEKDAMDKQYERVRMRVNETREMALTDKDEAKNQWPAFAKDEFDFSYTNPWQYLIVDNIQFFLMAYAHHYPKNFDLMRPKLRNINKVLGIFVEFNSKLQDFERELRRDIHPLIDKNDFDKSKYELAADKNVSEIKKYYGSKINEIKECYDIIKPENFSEMRLRVKFPFGELY